MESMTDIRVAPEDMSDEELEFAMGEASRRASLTNYAQILIATRQEAINARMSCGVEERWLSDMHQYYGIEPGSHISLAEAIQGKKPNPKAGDAQPRSKVYVQVTRQRTDAAVARLADMLYPTDERNWEIQPTPVPTLEKLRKRGEGLAMTHDDGSVMMHPDHPPTPGVPAQGDQPEVPAFQASR